MTQEEDYENLIKIAKGIARDIEDGDDPMQTINTWLTSATVQNPRARFRMMAMSFMIGAYLDPGRREELATEIMRATIKFDHERCDQQEGEVLSLLAFSPGDAEAT